VFSRSSIAFSVTCLNLGIRDRVHCGLAWRYSNNVVISWGCSCAVISSGGCGKSIVFELVELDCRMVVGHAPIGRSDTCWLLYSNVVLRRVA
jgi:hypothetical protein